ncbi:hypothetical protein L484_025420 [Morus notabilis]|uniref:Uncharacterized protein n=1 Tax=Morus notabilis TaxID=981085 RepID=W9RAK3_9ROSA|nr:hypothetical protein L484_025420 [Morus notabilis]
MADGEEWVHPSSIVVGTCGCRAFFFMRRRAIMRDSPFFCFLLGRGQCCFSGAHPWWLSANHQFSGRGHLDFDPLFLFLSLSSKGDVLAI